MLLYLAVAGASAHRAMRSSSKMHMRDLDNSVQEMNRALQADHDKIASDQAKLLSDQEQLIKLQNEELEAVRGNTFGETGSNMRTAVENTQAANSVSEVDSAKPATPEVQESATDGTNSAVEAEAAVGASSSARFSGVSSGVLSSSLHSYFEKHNPEKESNIEEIVKRFGNNPEKLSDELKAKYGEALDYTSAGSTARFSETSSKLSQRSTLTEALHSYFQANNPAKDGNVDEIVTRYGGNVDALSEKLEAKYGAPFSVPEPAAVMLEEASAVEMLSPDEVKVKLLKVYAENEPAKLPFVDSMMEMYEGRESELLHRVQQKFVDNV